MFSFIYRKIFKHRQLFGSKGKAGLYQELWKNEMELARHREVLKEQREVKSGIEDQIKGEIIPQRKYELEKKLREQEGEIVKTEFLIDGGLNPEKNDGKTYVGLQETIYQIKDYIKILEEKL